MVIVFQDGHKLKNLKCLSKPKKPLFGHFQDIDSKIRVSEKSNICPRYLPFHVLWNVKIYPKHAIFGRFLFKVKVCGQVLNAYINSTRVDFYSNLFKIDPLRQNSFYASNYALKPMSFFVFKKKKNLSNSLNKYVGTVVTQVLSVHFDKWEYTETKKLNR